MQTSNGDGSGLHVKILDVISAVILTLTVGLGSEAVQASGNNTAPAGQSNPREQLISVDDLLRFAAIGDPLSLDWNDDIGAPGIFSADGSQVVIVVRGGDPQHETNNGTLWLYTTADLMRDKPIKLAEFASSGPYQPIAFVRWLADNQTLVFAGTSGAEHSQIFSVNTRTHTLKQLTRFTEQFKWYDVAPSGNRLVTLVEPAAVAPANNPECVRYGCRVESTGLYDAEEHGGNSAITLGVTYNVLSSESMPLVSPENQDASLNFCDAELIGGISPDGRHAIRLCRLKGQFLPQWWGDYTMDPFLRECMAERNVRCWRRGVIIDLQSGRPLSWTDAPLRNASYGAAPIWIDGGRHVIFPSALESLTGVDAKERARRVAAYAVLIMDSTTRAMSRDRCWREYPLKRRI